MANDAVVDFNLMEDAMAPTDAIDDMSEKRKELLRKLHRKKAQYPAPPHQPQPHVPGIKRTGRCPDSDSVPGPAQESSASVANASNKSANVDNEVKVIRPQMSRKVTVNTNGGLTPGRIDDTADTLDRDCVSHPAEKTMYFCWDCKVFICVHCIAFGEHRHPHQVTRTEDEAR